MIKKLILIFMLLISPLWADTVDIPTTYSNGSSVTASNLNGNFTAITAQVNGGLDNNNANTTSGYRFFETRSSLPANGNQGRVVFLTTDNTLNFDNGASWQTTVTPTGTPSTGYIPYYNSGWALLAPGAQYLPLVSNGASSLPSYQTLSTHAGGTGQDFSATAQGNIFYTSATGTVSALGPGTSGQILSTQGAGANPQWINNIGFVPTGCQFFSSSGTWTKPAGISSVYVREQGPGGAGGDGGGSGNRGGGGGAYSEGVIAVTGNVTVTVGTAPVNANPTTASTDTTFVGSTTMTAGAGQRSPNTAQGGAGGTATGGLVNLSGQTAGDGASSPGGSPGGPHITDNSVATSTVSTGSAAIYGQGANGISSGQARSGYVEVCY